MKNWRYEYKMILRGETIDEARQMVESHPVMFSQRYPTRKVNNVYFDSHGLSNYYDALSGCSRRSKLRFRWYGESATQVRGALELKERNGTCITKDILSIQREFDLTKTTWSEFLRQLQRAASPHLFIESMYACTPIIINSYNRYYYETYDHTCRITLDFNLKSFDQRLFHKPNIDFETPLLQHIILEVKADCADVVSLERITNHLPYRICQNSKYVNGLVWV